MRGPETQLVEAVARIARRAGEVVLSVYATAFEARAKQDASPVTEADERSEEIILQGLSALTPGIAIVSEEAFAARPTPVASKRFWLVDPLDGTKEFVSRNGEFTVNIALVEDGRPTLGVVLAPALGRLYAGSESGGAWKEEQGDRRSIGCRPAPADGMVVVSSRSHGDQDALRAFLAGRRVRSSASAGSSLKFCLVASGEADLYPRLGRTMEWDTAAGQAVLLASGGRVTCLDGTALVYGKPGLANPHFVAEGLR